MAKLKIFSGPKLDQVCGDRDNNFNLIRIVAAAAVLISHAFPVTLGSAISDPILEPLIGLSMGWVAVAVFFVISGFLIARSFDTKAHLIDWAVARVLRIFPGLLVVLVLTVLVMGPLVTTLPLREYFLDPGIATYFLRCFTLVSIQYTLPGVFESLPHKGEINGSLWTLIHEVLCYMAVLVAGLLGMLRRRVWMSVALLGYLTFYALTKLDSVEAILIEKFIALRSLSLPFAFGMTLYIWRDKVPVNWWISGALAIVAITLYGTAFFIEFFLLWVAYTVFPLAYLPRGWIRKYNLLGDYSYGFYIYAFPIQQLMVFIFGAMAPWQNMFLSIPATLVCAILSWIWIEKPSLAMRHRVSLTLRNLQAASRCKSSAKSQNS